MNAQKFLGILNSISSEILGALVYKANRYSPFLNSFHLPDLMLALPPENISGWTRLLRIAIFFSGWLSMFGKTIVSLNRILPA